MPLPTSIGGILSDSYLQFGGTLASFEVDMQVTAEGYLPASFDWDGNTDIPCTAGQAEHGKELGVSGWETIRRVKINVRLENLPDPTDYPQPNDDFVLRLSDGGPETKYRVLKTKNSGDATLEIEGVDTNHPAV